MELRKAQAHRRDPVRYEIGKDISQAAYDELLLKVADWFAEWRKTKEPAADARFRLQCCLEGKLLNGQPWFSHWNSTFAARVMMLCRFDVATMKPKRTANELSKAKKDREREKKISKQRAGDPYIPDLTRKELGNKIKYGDDPHVLLTEAEHRRHDELIDSYQREFPQLRTINNAAELSMLCDVHVILERNRIKLLKGENVDESALNEYMSLMSNTKKALGIHPDQLAKRAGDKQGGSIAEAVAFLETQKWGRELREQMLIEDLLILWQMFHTDSPRADSDGKQLDEIGLHSMTGCYTCRCAKCGHPNYRGLSIDEVEGYLVRKQAEGKGGLKPRQLPVVPAEAWVDWEAEEADAARTEPVEPAVFGDPSGSEPDIGGPA